MNSRQLLGMLLVIGSIVLINKLDAQINRKEEREESEGILSRS